jgi:hypothetical protein
MKSPVTLKSNSGVQRTAHKDATNPWDVVTSAIHHTVTPTVSGHATDPMRHSFIKVIIRRATSMAVTDTDMDMDTDMDTVMDTDMVMDMVTDMVHHTSMEIYTVVMPAMKLMTQEKIDMVMVLTMTIFQSDQMDILFIILLITITIIIMLVTMVTHSLLMVPEVTIHTIITALLVTVTPKTMVLMVITLIIIMVTDTVMDIITGMVTGMDTGTDMVMDTDM